MERREVFSLCFLTSFRLKYPTGMLSVSLSKRPAAVWTSAAFGVLIGTCILDGELLGRKSVNASSGTDIPFSKKKIHSLQLLLIFRTFSSKDRVLSVSINVNLSHLYLNAGSSLNNSSPPKSHLHSSILNEHLSRIGMPVISLNFWVNLAAE